MTQPIERLIALVRRELGADSVRVLSPGDAEAEAENVLYGRLPDGRTLAVAFAAAPPSREALVRRLAMLTATFAHSLEEGAERGSRPPPSRSLREELRALAARAAAKDAAVIDAHSPVVWGEASSEPVSASPERVPMLDMSGARLTSVPDDAPSSDAAVANSLDDEGDDPRWDDAGEPSRATLGSRAIAVARALPGVSSLRKGGHVGDTVRRDDLGVFVRSFASIYLLVLAFDGAFDELRAERAVEDALPRIERLVMALPPLDPKPAPIAGVIAMRRRKR